MPDFTARLLSESSSVEYWSDEPVEGGYDRTNPVTGHSHRHQVAAVGVVVELRATVAGIENPDDSALGGRLFTTWAAEAPAVFGFTYPTVGRSSQVRFTPPVPGHYVIGMRRDGGGAVLLHLTVR